LVISPTSRLTGSDRFTSAGGQFATNPRTPVKTRAGALFALLGILTSSGSGCQSVGYYSQAIHGQCQILHRRQAIAELLKDPATPPALQTKLRLVLDLRKFAETELHLSANGHYLAYADLGRRYALWNVYAAPEFSLKAKSWWYPVVGRLKYRGYFSEPQARQMACKLKHAGYDVHVGGVPAYSTLGWFRDPVLNTFIDYEETDLAELLFHELTHQRLFIAGDTEFNEALATAVAEEGLRRWLESKNDLDALRAYQQEVRRHEQFIELITQTRAQLEMFYLNPVVQLDPNAARKRAHKEQLLQQLRHHYDALRKTWVGQPDFDAWFKSDLNNARLNTVDTYYQLVPAFRALLRSKRGDLDAFFAALKELSGLRKEQRRAWLAALEP
jgi:predicted aminopeptidase